MFFKKKQKPITINQNAIVLKLNEIRKNVPIEILPVITLDSRTPSISIFENNKEIIKYSIEPLDSNPNLIGQFIHLSVRVLDNFALMIDGLISNSPTATPKLNEDGSEAIRFQPVFLSIADVSNESLNGKGLFERGLHFPGTITPGNVRLSCVCDSCRRPFNLQSFHAGFSNGQYFYSTDSSRTLFVYDYEIDGMPGQLQKDIDRNILAEVESKLPNPDNGSGEYKYYNSLRCPHCRAEYIDFGMFPGIRPTEYYGNTFVNCRTQKIKAPEQNE